MKLLIRSQPYLEYYVVKHKLTELFSEGIVHIFSWLIDDETGDSTYTESYGEGEVSEQQRKFVAMNSLMKKTTSPTAKNALEIFS